MDSTTIILILVIGGGAVLQFFLRRLLNKGYDKARNNYARRKNANNPPISTKLSDMYDKQDRK